MSAKIAIDLRNTKSSEALSFYALQNGFNYSDCCTAQECHGRAEENDALDSYYWGEDLGLMLPDHATLRDFFASIAPESKIFE